MDVKVSVSCEGTVVLGTSANFYLIKIICTTSFLYGINWFTTNQLDYEEHGLIEKSLFRWSKFSEKELNQVFTCSEAGLVNYRANLNSFQGTNRTKSMANGKMSFLYTDIQLHIAYIWHGPFGSLQGHYSLRGQTRSHIWSIWPWDLVCDQRFQVPFRVKMLEENNESGISLVHICNSWSDIFSL